MRSLFNTLALATAAALLPGCFIAVEDDDDFDPPPVVARGDLSVVWTFDGYYDCGPVDEVRVTLTDPDGVIYDDSRYSCAVEGIIYEQVDEGWWTIDLIAVDRYGRVLYGGVADLFVNGNAFNEYDIDLTPR
jgi:hypothetical protein